MTDREQAAERERGAWEEHVQQHHPELKLIVGSSDYYLEKFTWTRKRLLDSEMENERLRASLRNLMSALEQELTGRPKNIPKSKWAAQWESAEAALGEKGQR